MSDLSDFKRTVHDPTVAGLRSEVARLQAEWSIMARAVGNWRTLPGQPESDHDHKDWQVAARAILGRDELKAEVDRLSALVPIGGDQPLRCRVINEAISIAIGQRILAVAFEFLPSLYDAENDRQRYRLTDAATFAESVVAEMNSEGEDGSTPLTRFIDSMIEETIEQGGNGFEENPPIPPLPGTEP